MAAKSAIAVKKPRELTEEEILKAPDKDYMNEAQLAFFKKKLLEIREQVLKSLEVARSEGLIGNSLDARVILEAGGDRLSLLRRYADSLNDLFIVSEVSLRAAAAPAGESSPQSISMVASSILRCQAAA